ncbi:zinc ribbon domain-containing protein [Mycolicibacterium elephantis]|uniref:zinc ribbon domain-containing protein n=1 Tax=Mycolicibacterium elephantis TaxID=81858 RepID=UPI001F2BADB3|nr:zinc ribbon domain-containing protein [Mycolicibacterium elephantis]
MFDRLGAELADRENRKEPTKRSTGLLLQVVYCGVCGRPAYRLKGGAGRKPRYRCALAQYRNPCGNRSIPLEYADETVESTLLTLLGTSERMERVWDSGSDHSAELAEIDSTLADFADQLGSPAFRMGTPQRDRLDARIEALAARQAELSAEAVKPAGWTWQPTGEKFANWWSRQDVTARNVWLRSMGTRLEFKHAADAASPNLHLDLGDLGTLTQQMTPDRPVTKWQRPFEEMKANAVQGMTINTDGSVTLTPREV